MISVTRPPVSVSLHKQRVDDPREGDPVAIEDVAELVGHHALQLVVKGNDVIGGIA